MNKIIIEEVSIYRELEDKYAALICQDYDSISLAKYNDKYFLKIFKKDFNNSIEKLEFEMFDLSDYLIEHDKTPNMFFNNLYSLEDNANIIIDIVPVSKLKDYKIIEQDENKICKYVYSKIGAVWYHEKEIEWMDKVWQSFTYYIDFMNLLLEDKILLAIIFGGLYTSFTSIYKNESGAFQDDWYYVEELYCKTLDKSRNHFNLQFESNFQKLQSFLRKHIEIIYEVDVYKNWSIYIKSGVIDWKYYFLKDLKYTCDDTLEEDAIKDIPIEDLEDSDVYEESIEVSLLTWIDNHFFD